MGWEIRIDPYFRVLEPGEVGSGDLIHRLRAHPVGMTIRQMSNLLYFEKDDLDGARRALRIEAMSPGWRQSFETASPKQSWRERRASLFGRWR